MKKSYSIYPIVLLTIVLFLTGCVSSTLIQSNPSGAKVFVNGEHVGYTPYWYSDTKVLGSITNIDLVKDGYEPIYTSIQRNEQVDVGAVIGGFCLGFPFLWTLNYYPTHSYELAPLISQPNQKAPENLNSQSVPTQTQPAQISTKSQRLRELKQLLDEKLINNDDFEKQKQKILESN